MAVCECIAARLPSALVPPTITHTSAQRRGSEGLPHAARATLCFSTQRLKQNLYDDRKLQQHEHYRVAVLTAHWVGACKLINKHCTAAAVFMHRVCHHAATCWC